MLNVSIVASVLLIYQSTLLPPPPPPAQNVSSNTKQRQKIKTNCSGDALIFLFPPLLVIVSFMKQANQL